ncbi:hypothetical protein RIF29_19460 [Crotalaria pallida]|uniref:Uncharacterized protein n=1 Tax=Crotalaria pallida TaxID=3830 RepID=A0AAN9EZJ8_CROPI
MVVVEQAGDPSVMEAEPVATPFGIDASPTSTDILEVVDEQRMVGDVVNVIKGNAQILAKQLLHSSSLALFVAKHCEYIFLVVNPKQKELRRSSSVHEEVLKNQCVETSRELEKQTKRLSKLQQAEEASDKAKEELAKAKESAKRALAIANELDGDRRRWPWKGISFGQSWMGFEQKALRHKK